MKNKIKIFLLILGLCLVCIPYTPETADAAGGEAGLIEESYVTTDSGWTKVNDTTWTYTFTVDDDSLNWTAYESTVPTGYDASNVQTSPKTVSSNAATITNTGKTYTVTFNPQGGTYSNTTGNTTKNVKYQSKGNGSVGAATKTNYTFAGWYTAASGGTQVFNASGNAVNGTYWKGTGSNALWNYAGNLTVHAHWNANYTISYDLDGGSYGTSHPTSAVQGTAFTVNIPTKTGYEFAGWTIMGMDTTSHTIGSATTTAQTYTSAANATSFNNLTAVGGATITFKATWAPKQATVNYNANGHGTAPAAQTIKYTEAASTQAGITGVAGYTFKNWNTAANGSGNSYNASTKYKDANSLTNTAGTTLFPGPTTFYAQWTTNTYKISYAGLDGASCTTKPTSATWDKAFTVSNPTKTGYTFTGWKITGMDSNTHTYGSSTTTATSINSTKETSFKNLHATTNSTVTFTAQWTANTYTISYDLAGGSYGSSHPTSGTYDSAVTIDLPTKSGYAFVGWEITGMDGCTHYWDTGSATTSRGTATSSNSYRTGATKFKNLRSTSGTVTMKAVWGHYIDLNGYLDGTSSGNITNFGTTDVYINGSKVATGVTDFYQAWPEGTTWEVKNIAAKTGKSYIKGTNTSGTLGTSNIDIRLHFGSTHAITYTLNSGTHGTSHPDSAVGSVEFTVSNPSRTAYTFNGWNITGMDSNTHTYGSSTTTATSLNNCKETKYKNLNLSGGTVNFAAQWTPTNYTITYDLKSGSHGTTHPTSYNIETATFTISDPTRTGYTFNGWTITTAPTTWGSGSSATGSKSFKVAKGTYGNIKLTANWTANTNTAYKVNHYTKDLGKTTYTLNSTDSKTGTSDGSLTLANLKKSITGFTYSEGFAGTAASGTTKPTSGAVTTTTVLADGTRVINLYYTRDTHKITLTKGTGIASVSGASNSVEYGATVSIDASMSNGYQWSKWTATSGGAAVSTTKAYSFTMGTSDVAYTANASVIGYTMTYDLAGGTHGTTHPDTFNVTTDTFTISDPTKTGYTFSGWTVTTAPSGWGSGSSSSGAKSFKVAKGTYGNIKLTATWTANPLTFNGSVIKKAYKSSAQTATITAASNGTGTYTYTEVSEKNEGGTATDYISIDGTTITLAAKAPAGKYTYVVKAKDSNSGSEKEATFTVTVARVTLSASSGTLTYPDTGTFTVKTNQSGGALSVKSKTTSVATATISGTTVTITPQAVTEDGLTSKITVTSAANGDYCAASASCTVTVNRSDGLTITPTPYKAVYDGNAHSAQLKSNIAGTAISYGESTSYGKSLTATNANTNYSMSEVTRKEGGTTTVYYSASKAGYKPKTGSTVIAISRVVLSSSSSTLTYGTNGTFTVTTNSSGGTLSVKSSDESVVKVSISGTTITLVPQACTADGKTATITVTSAATGNYVAATATHSVTVNRLDGLTATPTAYVGTYDTSAHSASIKANIAGATVQYGTSTSYGKTLTAANANTNYTMSDVSRTINGKTTVQYKVTKAGYKDKTGSTTITINPKFTNQSKEITYSPSSQTIDITAATAVDGSSYTYTEISEKDSNGSATNYLTISGTKITLNASTLADTYTYVIRATDTAHDNVSTDATYTIMVKKAGINIVKGDYSGVYDGNAHSGTLKSNVAGVSVQYGTSTSYGKTLTLTNANQNYNLSEVTRTNDGTTTVYYKVTKANYNDVTGSFTITVTPKFQNQSITKTFSTSSQTFNVTAAQGGSSFTYSEVSEKSGGNNTNYLTVSSAGVITMAASTPAGTYSYVIRAKDTDTNQTVDATYTVTVNKANNTLTLNHTSGTLTYPSTTPNTGAVSVTTNTSGGTLSVKSSNEDVATVTISGNNITITPKPIASDGLTSTITVTSAETANYKSATATYTVTVNRGTITLTATPYKGEADGKAHNVTLKSSVANVAIVYGESTSYGKTVTDTVNANAAITLTEVSRKLPGTTTVYYKATKAGYKDATGNTTIIIEDTTAPVPSITTSNNAAASQTATLKATDVVGVTSYYWGKKSNPTDADYTAITSTTSMSVNKTVSEEGTYYLKVKDAAGNVGSASTTFYKTTFIVTHGTSSLSIVLTETGKSFKTATVTADLGYTAPAKWSYGSSSTVNQNADYTPTASYDMKAVCTPNTYKLSYNLNQGTGSTAPSCTTKPATATYDANFTVSNPTRTGYEFTGWTITGMDDAATHYWDNSDASTARGKVTSDENNKYTKFKNLRATDDTVTFKANWKPIAYTITVTSVTKTVDGSTESTKGGTVTGTGSYNFDSEVTMKATVKEGYVFLGWAESKTPSSYLSTATTLTKTVTGAKTYYAIFEEQTAPLEYDENGHGDKPSDTLMRYSTETKTKGALVQTGYTFHEWNTKKDGTGSGYESLGTFKDADSFKNKNGETVIPTGDTLYAQWTPNVYKISYELSGGSNGSNAPATATFDEEFTVDNPTRTGYIFDGWKITGMSDTCKHYYGSSETTAASISSTKETKFKNLHSETDAVVTFTALWTPIKYDVTYELAGGTHGASHPANATYDVEFTVSNPTKFGYTFTGWKITGMDSVKHYYGSSTTSNTSISKTTATTFKNLRSTPGEVTFTAQWTPNEYTIEYVTDGGTLGSNKPTTAKYDKALTISKPTKTGFIFKGWDISGMSTDCTHYWDNSDASTDKGSAATATGVNNTKFKNLRSSAGTVTFTAKWKEMTGVVKYDANGHGTAPADQTVYYTKAASTPAALTITGFTFKEWNTKDDGTGKGYAAGAVFKEANSFTNTNGDTIITDGDTLYAIWEEDSATLTYHNNGHGTTPADYRMLYTKETVIAKDLSATGYIFKGWNTKEDGSGDMFSGEDTFKETNTYDNVNGDTVIPDGADLYAIWQEMSATISFERNGHGEQVEPQTMWYSKRFTMPANTNVEGYIFKEWNTKSDGKGTSYSIGSTYKEANSLYNTSNTQVIPSGSKVYAIWTEITGTLTYDANGHGTAPEPTVMRYSTVTKTQGMNNVEGWVFLGWATSKERAAAEKVDYQANVAYKAANRLYNVDDVTVLPQGATLYAVWVQDEGTLAYDVQGHGKAPSSIYLRYAQEATVATDTMKVEGWTFQEWNTKADGSGKAYKGGDVYKEAQTFKNTNNERVVPGGAKLYAIWIENTATLTYNLNYDGASTNKVTMKYTKEEKVPTTVPSRGEGFTFKEWNTGKHGVSKSYAPGSVFKAANTEPEDATLYAIWNEWTGTITYDKNGHGGTPPGPDTMKYSEEYQVANSLADKGWKFVGWNTKANGSGTMYQPGAILKPVNQTTSVTKLYAQWERIPVTLTVEGNGGTPDSKNYTLYLNSDDNTSVTLPTQSDYICTGLYTRRNGGNMIYDANGKVTNDGTYFDSGVLVYEGNFTLYAQWEGVDARITCVTYDKNCDDEVSNMPGNETKTLGKPIVLKNNVPKRDGYTFVCWSTTPDGNGDCYYTQNGSGSSFPLVSDDVYWNYERGPVTLYAIWQTSEKEHSPNPKLGVTYNFYSSDVENGLLDSEIVYKYTNFFMQDKEVKVRRTIFTDTDQEIVPDVIISTPSWHTGDAIPSLRNIKTDPAAVVTPSTKPDESGTDDPAEYALVHDESELNEAIANRNYKEDGDLSVYLANDISVSSPIQVPLDGVVNLYMDEHSLYAKSTVTKVKIEVTGGEAADANQEFTETFRDKDNEVLFKFTGKNGDETALDIDVASLASITTYSEGKESALSFRREGNTLVISHAILPEGATGNTAIDIDLTSTIKTDTILDISGTVNASNGTISGKEKCAALYGMGVFVADENTKLKNATYAVYFASGMKGSSIAELHGTTVDTDVLCGTENEYSVLTVGDKAHIASGSLYADFTSKNSKGLVMQQAYTNANPQSYIDRVKYTVQNYGIGGYQYRIVDNTELPGYVVAANVNDEELGYVNGDGEYAEGAIVELEAVTKTDAAEFLGWYNNKGDRLSTKQSWSFRCTGNIEVTAKFRLKPHTVTATVNDSKMGTVTGAGEYGETEIARLTAVPNENYSFVGWVDPKDPDTYIVSGEGTDAEGGILEFVVTEDVTYKAVFAPLSYKLHVEVPTYLDPPVTADDEEEEVTESLITVTVNDEPLDEDGNAYLEYNEHVVLEANVDPSRTGYSIKGFYDTDREEYICEGSTFEFDLAKNLNISVVVNVNDAEVENVLNNFQALQEERIESEYASYQEEFLEKLQPVGSIYTSTSETLGKGETYNDETIEIDGETIENDNYHVDIGLALVEDKFGGKWERIENKFLYAQGEDELGATGGKFRYDLALAMNADSNSLAYVLENKNEYQKHTLDDIMKMKFTPITTAPSHGVVVTEAESESRTTKFVPPYQSVYVFKRVE